MYCIFKKFKWLLAVKLPLFRYAGALYNCEREFLKLLSFVIDGFLIYQKSLRVLCELRQIKSNFADYVISGTPWD